MHGLFSVEGKSVVVTGGSRGIGYMIAEGFVRAGARVYLTGRKADTCLEAAARLAEWGACEGLPTDLSEQSGIASFVTRFGQREDSLNVLVNNAGATWGAPLGEYPRSAWDKVLTINVTAVFELTVGLLPLLRAAAEPDDPARVINIGSAEGTRPGGSENFAYPASKAAVAMLSRQLALRLAPESITVNVIAPGPFESKMMAFLLDDDGSRAAVAAKVPLGRIGRPDDMVGAAIFLASRAGAYLTGAVLPVDGGLASS